MERTALGFNQQKNLGIKGLNAHKYIFGKGKSEPAPDMVSIIPYLSRVTGLDLANKIWNIPDTSNQQANIIKFNVPLNNKKYFDIQFNLNWNGAYYGAWGRAAIFGGPPGYYIPVLGLDQATNAEISVEPGLNAQPRIGTGVSATANVYHLYRLTYDVTTQRLQVYYDGNKIWDNTNTFLDFSNGNQLLNLFNYSIGLWPLLGSMELSKSYIQVDDKRYVFM